MGKVPTASEGGQNPRWRTSGQGGYITLAGWGEPHRFGAWGRIRSGPQIDKVTTSTLPPVGVPPASERGAESEVAHKWARWLHNPYRLGGSPALQSGGHNHK